MALTFTAGLAVLIMAMLDSHSQNNIAASKYKTFYAFMKKVFLFGGFSDIWMFIRLRSFYCDAFAQ